MKRNIDCSINDNKSSLKLLKNEKDEIDLELDLNEILNIEFEEEREQIQLLIQNMNPITHTRDIRDYFRTFGNVISCGMNANDARNYNLNYAIIILEDKDELLNKIMKSTHILNGTQISVYGEKLKKKGKYLIVNSGKTKQKFSYEEENDLLLSSKANKIRNDSIKPNNSLIFDNSFSKFDALNFTFHKENNLSESSNKNNKKNLSNKDKENNSSMFLTHKRTSNFSLGLSLDETKTHFDFFSNADCPSTPTFKNRAYSNESLFKKNSSKNLGSTKENCSLDDVTKKINSFFNWS